MRLTMRCAVLAVLVLLTSVLLSAVTPTMTASQRATLKTAIQADPVANQFFLDGNLTGLAARLNETASPSFTVWKTAVAQEQVGRAFNTTELAGLSALNTQRLQNIEQWFDVFNPTLPTDRAFFDDIFSGAGGANTRAALLVLWKRLATRVERPFATGTGSDAVPGVIVIEGPISTDELVGL
jgi:hypothetical protein